MGFKLVSKNNMGIVITLILLILLSQSRFFDFFTETALGRMIILVLIVLISYTNKFLGLLAVLFIIIAFNQYSLRGNVVQSYNFYEGFDGSGNQTASVIIQDKINIEKAKEDILNQKLKALNDKASTSQTTTSQTTTTTSESFGAREGFCMTDRESNIMRGKESNSIPVFNNARNQDDNISPTDKSIFSTSFSSF